MIRVYDAADKVIETHEHTGISNSGEGNPKLVTLPENRGKIVHNFRIRTL